ncbi:MAG: hypothetical protein Q7U16_07605 [Agitococcus sp.]|nr:hypothetical protein [Agitococcus sp.]
MFNTLETYAQTGKAAAEAMNKKDAGLYDHHKRWLSKALALENGEDKKAARAAYDAGYTQHRHVPRPLPFA